MIRNFVDGDIVTSGEHFLEGRAATAQGAYYRLRMFLGEFFLDITDGTPWFQSILGKTAQDVAELNVKQRILTSKDVVAISEFNFTPDTDLRKISVQAGIVDINNEQVQLILNEDVL